MSNKSIGDYSAANSIDASNDYYLIQQSGVYKKINRNVGLGLSSAPLGTTDSQSPQNKTFDNTNSLTIKDGSLTLQNSSSTTKQAVFSAASITAGQTRTFTFPDASGTIVTAAGTQTLTNKTITSPTISGGSIDNSTITVDAISGHTTGTLVTVANLQISNGVLNSANAVTATSIADGAVQPKALVTGTGSGWAWQSYTPTITLNGGASAGNATVAGKYIQIGKSVNFNIKYTVGTTTNFASLSSIYASLPVTASTTFADTAYANFATGVAQISGVNYLLGNLVINSTTIAIVAQNASSTYTAASSLTASIPGSWVAGSTWVITGTYEAA